MDKKRREKLFKSEIFRLTGVEKLSRGVTYDVFIEVNGRGRCSSVQRFNPYSAVLLEEKLKYA